MADNENFIILEALTYSGKVNGGNFAFLDEVLSRVGSQGVSKGSCDDFLCSLERKNVIQIHKPNTTDSGTFIQITF